VSRSAHRLSARRHLRREREFVDAGMIRQTSADIHRAPSNNPVEPCRFIDRSVAG
jgi:hypothetical protein